MTKYYFAYRNLVYKVLFLFFGEVAAMLGLFLSGDVFRLKNVDFTLSVKEVEDK